MHSAIGSPRRLLAEDDSGKTRTSKPVSPSISSELFKNTERTVLKKRNSNNFFATDPLIIDSNSDEDKNRSFSANLNLIRTSTPFCDNEASSIAEHQTKSAKGGLSITDLIDSSASSHQNVGLRHDVTERTMSITDVKTIKKFIDSVLKFEEWNLNTIKEREYLDKLFRDAAMQTAIESMNLQKKGFADTQRYVQLCKQLSINSIEISRTAALARTTYNQAAKRINDARLARIPKLDDNVKAAFRNVFYSKVLSYAAHISKEAHVYYETASDLKKTALYQSVLEELVKENH